MKRRFNKSFTQQEAIPEEGIEAAVQIMRSGRLHRYNTAPGQVSEVAQLESDFAQYTGSQYCLACASGGYALAIALRAVGVQPGDKVLCNGFTLAPVPGAIHNVGAVPVWVEITEDLVLDLEHLEYAIKISKSRFLLLSHMRGHSPDMEALTELCERFDVCLIEDCAHTLGARWNGRASGTFGRIGCYSTQTYKHINSGEGGLLVTDDASVMAKATLLSGSYMLFDRHLAGPPTETVDELIYTTPNYSGRLDNLRASILMPQLAALDANALRWNRRYHTVAEVLATCPEIKLPVRPAAEEFVGSSLQFRLPNWPARAVHDLVGACLERGVELKWFGADKPAGYTSRYDHWRYFSQGISDAALKRSDEILAVLLDMRIPLTFTLDDCQLVAEIIVEEVKALAATQKEL